MTGRVRQALLDTLVAVSAHESHLSDRALLHHVILAGGDLKRLLLGMGDRALTFALMRAPAGIP
ncbi:hypothetical protein WDJ51_11680 [Rathayibacter sp. YIM 133350]|uniref:hypothetical protein n=1 Tax=Rathayibacter sp. YIM 133350 TaxID=3131992 RepID=UPI00307D4F70